MSIESLISVYGYPAIAVGTFLEGETILVIAGFAAHQGYLKLTWVIFWAFLGTLCGDQLYFHLGRIKGMQFLDQRPYWKLKSNRVFDVFHRHPLPLVIGFRFLYGMRTITPFLLGASGFPSARFFILNFIGGLFWAVLTGVAGFLFGRAIESLVGKAEHYETFSFIGLAALGALIWGVIWFRKRGLIKILNDHSK